MASSKRYIELTSMLQQDIANLNRDLPRLTYLVEKLEKSTVRATQDTVAEIRRVEDSLQEVVRKSLLNIFQVQMLCGHNTDWKLRVKKQKQDLDRFVERFCAVHSDADINIQKYCPPEGGTDTLSVEYRRKTGTFSSIQEEVDTATELMREGVDHVLTRNSVMYTHTDCDPVTRENDRFDTTNLQRCYRTLMTKKRTLLEADDTKLSIKQIETKRKLLHDINELTRMYDDLQQLVDEQTDEIDKIETELSRPGISSNKYLFHEKEKKKCIVM